MARSLGIALLCACLVVAAADLALRVVVSLFPTPHSYDVARNPHFRRGWNDFTRPRQRAEGTRLVVVISNSQGFLRENPDASLAYPALLARDLTGEGGAEVIVANWSIPGAQAPEMIVLAARAAQHRPDAVVLVAAAGNFSPAWRDYPLSFWLSDAPLLVYDPAVRSRLPAAFLERGDARDPLGWFAARAGLGVARRRFVEKRDEAWSFRSVAPGSVGRGSFLGRRGEAFTLGARTRQRALDSAAVPIDPRRAEATEQLLAEFVASLRGTSPETALLVVGMPYARPSDPGALWHAATAFAPVARGALSEVPDLEFLDALEVVPSELFVHETHLNPEGHARLASWLLPHVRRALGGSPG